MKTPNYTEMEERLLRENRDLREKIKRQEKEILEGITHAGVWIKKLEDKSRQVCDQLNAQDPMKPTNARYTVQRCRKDNTRYGKIHFSDDSRETRCGITMDENWWILTNCFDGEATCPKCKNPTNQPTNTMTMTDTPPPPAPALDDATCSASSNLTKKRGKQKIQKNSPLQDKGLLRVIFANEAKRNQNPIYQKTEML